MRGTGYEPGGVQPGEMQRWLACYRVDGLGGLAGVDEADRDLAWARWQVLAGSMRQIVVRMR
jgi:hypothetical protein